MKTNQLDIAKGAARLSETLGGRAGGGSAQTAQPSDEPEGEAKCPRCGGARNVQLEKMDPQAHTCYRCRNCGHIFSPRTAA